MVFTLCFCFSMQRDPAEEALKSNNMNLDQAMSRCYVCKIFSFFRAFLLEYCIQILFVW